MDKIPLAVSLADKPHLKQLLESDKKAAMTMIKAFVDLFEVAAKQRWDKLPSELDQTGEMTFESLLHGMVLGSFSVKEFNPELYDVLGMSIHPLAILKKQNLMSVENGDNKMYDWREFYALPTNAKVDKDSIAEIIRNILRYNRWIPTKAFYEALGEGGDSIAIFKQMEENQVAKLAFLPALRYQKKHLGELHVGKFLRETALFDCGTLSNEVTVCPSCQIEELRTLIKDIKGCTCCQAGFTITE